LRIRRADHGDRDGVYSVHWAAFEKSERALISKLAVDLLAETSSPEVLSLVADSDGVIVGHVAFSPVTVEGVERPRSYILGPLGVTPGFQKQGVGTRLIGDGVRRLREADVDIVLVYGDPGYYSRFGFTRESAVPFIPPYKLQYAFGWLAMSLNDRVFETSSRKIACVTSLCDPALW
jgi:predicted N-acetyltransferase YhbS